MSFQFRLSRLAERTERPGDDLVAVRVVERDRIDDVLVALQRQQLVARRGVPDLAGAVVAARDESPDPNPATLILQP